MPLPSVLAGWMTLLAVLVSSAVAQPPPELPRAAAETEDNQTFNSAQSAEPNVRRIYVPVAELNALLKGDRQGVLLPRAEFQRLYAAAKQAEASALNEPAPVVVTAADYTGHLDQETLRLSAEVRFTQFDDQAWQIVRLPLEGLSVRSAVLDNQPAPIARDGKDRNSLVVFSAASGQHRLQLELSLPIKSVGSDWVAEFPTLGAPSGTLSLSIAEGKSLLVDGLTAQRSDPDDPASEFQVPLGGRSRVSLRVTDSDLRNVADALVFAHTAYGVHVAPGEVTWTTQTAVQTYGQNMSQLTFTVPSELEVAAVESTGLEKWVLADGDRGREQQITLTYRQPFRGERAVTIRGVLVPEDEEWTLPTLVLNDADSQVGTILVRHGPEIRLQAEHDDDVRPVSENSQPRSLQYRTMRASFELEFRTLGKARSVHVAMTNLLDVSAEGLDLQTVTDVETYFAPMFDVQITLPADFAVTAAHVKGAPVDWSRGTGVAGVIEVRVPLEPPLHPGETRRVTLSAHADPEDWPLQRDPVLLPFPEVGLPQADMIEARYGIMADEDLQVRTVDLTGLDPARQAELSGLRQAATAAGRELRLGYNYQDTVLSGQLEVARKPTRLAVSTWALSRLEPQTVQTELQLLVTIEGGGTEGLLVQLPESTGTDLRFSIDPAAGQARDQRVSIVEQTTTEPINGRRTWALRFDRRMHGDHTLHVSLVEPRPEEGPVTLPVATLTGAERQNGWIAVEARNDQRLAVQASGADGRPLPKVDPIDLPGLGNDVSNRRIVAAVRYVQPGYQVLVAEQSLETAPVPTAMADRAESLSVLSESGLMLHRLDVTFRAVGMQSLLLTLPEASDVWGVLIDGEPVEVRETEGGYRVPLSTVDDPSAPRTLRLIYRSQEHDPGAFGRLRQSPPQLVCVTGAGQAQPLEILQQEWTLHYPSDVVLLDSHGLFTPTSELLGAGWLSRTRHAMTVPSLEEAGRRVVIVAAIVLVLWFAALVWRRFGNSSLVVLAIGLPVVVTAILFYTFAKQEVTSSAYFAKTEATDDPLLSDAEPQSELRSLDPAARPADARAGAELSQQTQEIPSAEMAEGQQAAPPADQPQRAEPAQAAQQGAPARDFEAETDGDDVLAGLPGVPARGALLSLSLDLEPPAGHRSQTFRTLAPAGQPALDVTYGGRSFREVIAIILAAGVALLLWLLREAELKTKLAFLLATIVVPIALAPVLPASMTMILEGVLLGGLVGLLLWGVLLLVPWLSRRCQCCCPALWSRTDVTRTTTTALLTGVSLFLVTDCGRAQPAGDDGKSVTLQPDEVIRPSFPRMTEKGNLNSAHSSEVLRKSEAPPVVAADEPPTVVVPYEGDDPRGAERVYLPQELFRELWRKARPDELPRPPAPVKGLVAEALYVVDVPVEKTAGEQAETTFRVRGRLVVFGFREHPVWVPLPLDQVAVDSATMDDRPAVLQPRQDGQLELLVPSSGMHVLDLTFDVAGEVRRQSGQFTLPLRPVASGSLTVTLPATEQEPAVRVIAAGRPAVSSATTANDENRHRIDTSIDQGGPVRVSWQPQASRAQRENLVQVESRTALVVADRGVEMTAEYVLQVRQGLLTEVPFAFPEAVRLKQFTGPDVGGWQIEGTGAERTLTIFLRRNIEDRTTIIAELFLPQEDRDDEYELSVPEFAPLGMTRETGELAVLAGAHLDVRETEAEGLRQLDRDAVRLPESMMKNTAQNLSVQLAYRFAARPWQLSLSVQTRPPQTIADCEHGVYLGYRKILYRSRMIFELTGAPRQTLRLSLSDGFQVTEVVGEAVEDWFLEDIDLVIDLGQPRVGRVELMLEGHLVRDEGDDYAAVVTPLPLELDRQQSTLAVWIDPVFSATLDSFETWRTIDRAELPSTLRALHGDEPQFAFLSPAVVPEIVGFNLTRRQPQVVPEGVTLIAVSDVSVDYGLTLRWTIERAATDMLAFTTPDWLQDRLEFTGEDIRQTTQEAIDDGRVRWTVQLADAVQGQYLLTAVATLPPPADGRVAAPNIRFEQAPLTPGGEFTELDSQQTFAILVNLSRGRLSPVGDLEPLSVRQNQLPFVLRNELIDQAMATIRVPETGEVAWTLQNVTEQQTQAAQVTGADLTTVLAADGTVRTEANYRVRNRGHQFLALKLPQGVRILSVLVKGEPARCLEASVGEQAVSLVPLPQTSLADLSFPVRVVVQGEVAGTDRLSAAPLGADHVIPVPSVVSPNESREYGVPVVHTTWTVHVPDELVAVPVEDALLTNVSYQQPEEARKAILRELLGELAEQSKLAKSKYVSEAQRQKAAENIDQLRSNLGTYGGVAQQQFLEESSRIAEEVHQEIEGKPKPGFTNINTLGRLFCTSNNFQIAQDNRGAGAIVSQEQVQEFRFDRAKSDEAAAADKAEGKAAATRSKLRGRLESQVPMLGSAATTSQSGRQPANLQERRIRSGAGGLGGGTGADFQSLTDATQQRLPDVPGQWQERGGLSLPIDLPTAGSTLTFSKLGGDPKLTLTIRPRETGRSFIRWLWAIVVFIAGAWLLHQLAHRANLESCRRGVYVVFITVGQIGLLCLPLPLNVIGAILLIAGSLLGLLRWQPASQS